ncbi:MAG: hypothetical protein IPH32_10790 [Bacteroidetes bacterium]|nr:hypothetical protein [Bacteroidota bacterium]
MTNQEEHMNFEDMCQQSEKSQRRGKVIGGILVVIAGSLYLSKELGADIPHWLFTWKTFLIALGIITGVKHNFRNAWWFFLIAIGGIFLLGDFYPQMNIQALLWPILIILVGIIMIFKPKRKHRFRHWGKYYEKNTAKNTRRNTLTITKKSMALRMIIIIVTRRNLQVLMIMLTLQRLWEV